MLGQRTIAWAKKNSELYDPLDYFNDPEGEFKAKEAGKVPKYFDFTGRIVFISNLPKSKADPDARSLLFSVEPDDETLLERIKRLLKYIEPGVTMTHEEKVKVFEEIFTPEFVNKLTQISMRTPVLAFNVYLSGYPNWKRQAQRQLLEMYF